MISKDIKEMINECDIYNNSGSDDCKYKYNNIVYAFFDFIGDDTKTDISKRKKKILKGVIEYNKEALILYLNLCLDVLNDQKIDEEALKKEDFSCIKDLKNNLDLNTFKGKKVILNQLRNAFAHKGEIVFFQEDNIKKVRINNQKWFSVQGSVDDINKVLRRSIIIDNQDKLQNMIVEAINNIENNNYEGISSDIKPIILINLFMCYNKESIFDKYMLTQTALIDTSKFEIKSVGDWDKNESRFRQQFFDKFNIHFNSKKDLDSYNDEWRKIIDIDEKVVKPETKYTYNIDNMPIDISTGNHIPIPIFLNCLRNANSHGRVKLEGENFIFYDKDNSNNNSYVSMKISKDDLLKFIDSDYFKESISTTINKHKNKHNEFLYGTEKAESGNDIANYMSTYISRMKDLSEHDVIKYMYDNNKFSTYLMEFPDQTQNFLDYKLKDGTELISVLAGFENQDKLNFTNLNRSSKRNFNLEKEYGALGSLKYVEFLDDQIDSIKNNKEYSDRYQFFDVYYLFMRNLGTIAPNIRNTMDLPKGQKETIERGSKELQKEFIDNDLTIDIEHNKDGMRLMYEVGMQSSQGSEMDKIIFACSLNKKQEKKFKNSNQTKKYKRHRIANIERHSTLAHVIEGATKQNIEMSIETRKKLMRAAVVNLGIAMFCRFSSVFLTEMDIVNPELGFFAYVFFATRGYKNAIKIIIQDRKSRKKAKKNYDTLTKYATDEEGDNDYENTNTGSNNIRK